MCFKLNNVTADINYSQNQKHDIDPDDQ
uniref:Uncharacterized protein n=1 Tax=Rhizophora mucronata TaxID=61149 RepID=A0A2P2JLM0_RHIMU